MFQQRFADLRGGKYGYWTGEELEPGIGHQGATLLSASFHLERHPICSTLSAHAASLLAPCSQDPVLLHAQDPHDQPPVAAVPPPPRFLSLPLHICVCN